MRWIWVIVGLVVLGGCGHTAYTLNRGPESSMVYSGSANDCAVAVGDATSNLPAGSVAGGVVIDDAKPGWRLAAMAAAIGTGAISGAVAGDDPDAGLGMAIAGGLASLVLWGVGNLGAVCSAEVTSVEQVVTEPRASEPEPSTCDEARCAAAGGHCANGRCERTTPAGPAPTSPEPAPAPADQQPPEQPGDADPPAPSP